MPFYNLRGGDTNDILWTAAGDREAALMDFGVQLGTTLTLVDQDVPPPYMMDENLEHESPRWLSFNIPVFEVTTKDETPEHAEEQA